MRHKILPLILSIALLGLSACCCSELGIDPPQPNQYIVHPAPTVYNTTP